MKKIRKELTKGEILQGYLYLDADVAYHLSEPTLHHSEPPNEIMVTFENWGSDEVCKYNPISKRLFGFKEWYIRKNAREGDSVEIEVEEGSLCVSYRSQDELLFPPLSIPDQVPVVDEDYDERSVLYEFFEPSDIGHGKDDYIRREMIGLFLRKYDRVFIRAVSRYYPLNEYLLTRYAEEWDWSELSNNKNISLSESTLSTGLGRWNWWVLSQRTDLPWSEDIIREFDYHWDWQCLSENDSIPWTVDLMEEYRDKILWSLEQVEYEDPYDDEGFSDPRLADVYYPRRTICSNPNIDWDVNLIKKYIEHVDLSELCNNPSIEWSDELLDAFKDQLDWEALCYGNNVEWSDDNIQKYMDFIDWRVLSRNRNFKWNEETIKKYEKKIDWSELSANPSLDISLEFVKAYEDKFDWSKLSGNPGNLNTIRAYSFACKFESRIDWRAFSANTRVYWDWELVDKFLDRLDWDEFSRNPAVAGKIVLIKDFESRVNWRRLSENIGINFTNDFVIKYKDKWDWEVLLTNPEFNMSTEIYDHCIDDIRPVWLSKEKYYKLAKHSHSDFVLREKGYLQNDESFHNDFSMIENMPWSLHFLLRNINFESEEIYNENGLCGFRQHGIGVGENRAIWERVFSPFVDDELIERVMSAHGAVPKKPKHLSDEDDEPLPF